MQWIKDKHGELRLEREDGSAIEGEEVFFDTMPHGGNFVAGKNVGGHADVVFSPQGVPSVVPGGNLQPSKEAKLYRDAKKEKYNIIVPSGICKLCGKEFTRATTRQKYCGAVCKRKAQNDAAAKRRKERGGK